MRHLILAMFVFSTLGSAMAQYEDWTFPKTAVAERKVIPYRYIREANVRYAKRIDRVIDVREKMNKIMEWPRSPFYNVIHGKVMKGELNPYRNDSLTSIYTPEEIAERGVVTYVTTVQDMEFPDDPGAIKDTTITIPFDPSKIKKYRIMEDWIFDHNYSDFRPKIIAIAPLFKPIFAGVELAEQPIYWVKMDDLRPTLVNVELFNSFNDAARLSYDDFFQMRMFSSYIVKESNVYDMDINMFEEFKDDGIAAQLESDRIKNDLFIFEHDLWQY
ncbi:MAG: gliding motility protein GldN [Flavobacteriales bacterium]|nr:gliding motility protein GldN [Flavobacteriales bacterium]